MRKFKNGKATGKDEVTGEMIKGGNDMVVEWIWRLCNMAFENGVVPEDWRSAVILLCLCIPEHEDVEKFTS